MSDSQDPKTNVTEPATPAVTTAKEDDDLADILGGEEVDKVDEYFRLKKVVSTLRKDLKDLQAQHEVVQELNKLSKKVKELREEVKADDSIHNLSEKISTLKERMDLIKEIIRVNLLESGQEEVKRSGKKLKLIYILKELKDEEEKAKATKKFFRN